ncbi:MAG TPA: PAC2 family protein [Nitrosopumilaceae archaeon]|nr:PAC2 family protein [Nitrosopumilaceae archaeon]
MEFFQEFEPDLKKPIVIAAMQDMGNVGGIVVDFINDNLKTKKFRIAKSSYPSYVMDRGGHIELPDEKWEYRYADDLIVFGGGIGQPQSNEELHALCQDVIDVSKKHSAKFIYTLGGFHTNRQLGKEPQTFVTATSTQLKAQLEKSNFQITPQKSLITGFNGLVLGYAKTNGISGIGLYGELNEPEIPQYRAAKSIIKTLEKLTYQKLGDTTELDVMADDIDEKMKNYWPYKFKQ